MTTVNPSASPLVSVIIPTYNRPIFLKEAIASVVRQTYKNLEIIVVDDYSQDDPEAIVNGFQDQRIQFSRNPSNRGILDNIIGGFRKARGKYVASLNDDDIWQESFLEKLITPLEAHANLVLAFCDYYAINEDGTVNEEITEDLAQSERRHLLKEGIYQPFYKIGVLHRSVFVASATVIRREAIDWNNFPPEAGVYWDLYTAYLATRTGLGAYYCPERLMHYRVHPNSETMISGNKDIQAKIRKGRAAVFCHKTFMEDENLKPYRSYFEREWARANTTLGIGLLRARKAAEARPYFVKALRQQKFNLRTIGALILSFIPFSLARPFVHIRMQHQKASH